MLTFLQAYLCKSAASYREFLLRRGDVNKTARLSEVNLMRSMAECSERLWHIPDFTRGVKENTVQTMLKLSSVAPFLRTADDEVGSIFARPAKAVQPSADLVAHLSHSTPPRSTEQEYLAVLSREVCYVDLPHRALMVTAEQELRAVFSSPFLSAGKIFMTAITTRPGSNIMVSHITWILGMEPFIGVPRGVAPDYLRQTVESLLQLLVLYSQCRAAGDAKAQFLPHMPPDQVSANARRESQRLKKFSLFRVERLETPDDKFCRPRQTLSKGGWDLQYRVAVKGHFKMQAHGPRRTLRKLVWVDAYQRGPEDGLMRTDLKLIGKGANDNVPAAAANDDSVAAQADQDP